MARKKTANQLEREIAVALQQQAATDPHARSVLDDLVERRGGPQRADFSGAIKRALRTLYGVKVRMRTNATKNPFIVAWIPGQFDVNVKPPPLPFPADLRNLALDVDYGEGFERNRLEPSAGNVSAYSIALHKDGWKALFQRLGHQLDAIE